MSGCYSDDDYTPGTNYTPKYSEAQIEAQVRVLLEETEVVHQAIYLFPADVPDTPEATAEEEYAARYVVYDSRN